MRMSNFTECAVKLVTPTQQLEHMIGPRLIREEAKALQGMSNEHVVKCYGTGTGTLRMFHDDSGKKCASRAKTPARYLALEYFSGGSLLQAIWDGRTRSRSFTKRVFKDLVETLGYIHGRGLAHRDIKPENVMFDKNLRTAFIDFGLVCPAGGRHSADLCYEVAGSHLYWAPELYHIAYPYGYIPALADIYALGLTLFEMIYGFAPFYRPLPWWGVDMFQRTEFWDETARRSGVEADPLANDLLGWMLMPNALHRPAPAGVLKHPWLATIE